MLGAENAGVDEVFERGVRLLGLVYGGVDHVEADFSFVGVQRGADVVDCCCVGEEAETVV